MLSFILNWNLLSLCFFSPVSVDKLLQLFCTCGVPQDTRHFPLWQLTQLLNVCHVFHNKSEKRVKVNERSVLSSDTTMMSTATKMFQESGYWNLCRSRCRRRCLSFLKSYVRYYKHYACSVRDTIKFPAFSYGQAKAIGIQYVNLVPRDEVDLTIRVDAYNFENGGKISVFKKNTSGYVWAGPYLRNHTKKRCYVAVRVYLV